jgi:adenine-specific DNA-methyltransferase
MANITKHRRDEMIQYLNQLKEKNRDDQSIRALNEIENALTEKKFGLVFEEHTEEAEEKLKNFIPVYCQDQERRIFKNKAYPYHFIIEGDNLHALYLLEKTHKGKIDCIYIDPPYNTGAHDWKYSNDYVDDSDQYRHSKWLSMMKVRLLLAKKLLNPNNSTLICTIDEKEFLHLGCLLEEIFPSANIQMISSVIKSGTSMRQYEFSRCNEYIFYVRIGSSVIRKEIPQESSNSLPWRPLMRSGTGSNNFRPARPNSFYPIFINKITNKVDSVGASLPLDSHPQDVVPPFGCDAIFPLKKDGTEMVWGTSSDTLKQYFEKGYARVKASGGKANKKYSIEYITSGVINDIEEEKIITEGFDEYGGISGHYLDGKSQMPQNQWNNPTHNATVYGTNLLKTIIGNRFTFPKSLYAVRDCLSYVIKDNPNAKILDFFAGSGTTLHAVNLLNAEDGGHRSCILVTNNEISEEEENKFLKMGLKKGDQEWEDKGIARFVTWPRAKCTINGVDYKGAPLSGQYLGLTSNSPTIPMANGFDSNVLYFKCEWIDRKPNDYLLSNALCLHIKEMIEIQNGLEIDNQEYILILIKEDYYKYILGNKNPRGIKEIWVNQNIVFDIEEIKRLEKYHFQFVPKEFFGQELKEVAE